MIHCYENILEHIYIYTRVPSTHTPLKILSAGEEVENVQLLHTAGENIKVILENRLVSNENETLNTYLAISPLELIQEV